MGWEAVLGEVYYLQPPEGGGEGTLVTIRRLPSGPRSSYRRPSGRPPLRRPLL